MVCIVLANAPSESLGDLAAGLSQTDNIEIVDACSRVEVMDLIESRKVDVLVTGAKLIDVEPLDLVTEVMKSQPLINCAMVSSMSPADFHEHTEGLGVFMQLPAVPGAKESKEMLQILESIDVLLKS